MTNISLKVVDPAIVQIEREGLVVGGVHLKQEKLSTLEVYGFTRLTGPWGCGPCRGLDCVVSFRPGEIKTRSRKYCSEIENLGMKLTIAEYETPHYSTTIDLGCEPGSVRFQEKGDTHIDVFAGKKRRGRIWSRSTDGWGGGTLPYPHRSDCVDLVQICGFDGMGEVVRAQEEDLRYTARAVFYDREHGFNSNVQFGVGSMEELFQRLDGIGQGVQATLSAAVPSYGPGKMQDLVQQLRQDNQLVH